MNATTLTAFVQGNGLHPEPDIEWAILSTADPYRPGRGPNLYNEQAGKPEYS